MVNVSASQQDMKKSRLTYLRHILVHASHRQDRNYIGIEKTIISLLTNLGQHQLYCDSNLIYLREIVYPNALQNWLAPKPKLASKLAKKL